MSKSSITKVYLTIFCTMYTCALQASFRLPRISTTKLFVCGNVFPNTNKCRYQFARLWRPLLIYLVTKHPLCYRREDQKRKKGIKIQMGVGGQISELGSKFCSVILEKKSCIYTPPSFNCKENNNNNNNKNQPSVFPKN